MMFPSNYEFRRHIEYAYPRAYKAKRADVNPRGDIYTPKRKLIKAVDIYNHESFNEPKNHTRSVEYYEKSLGSVAPDERGIPKWWRDIEYTKNGIYPPSFVLSPCWIYSRPMLWTSYKPGRANLKLDTGVFVESIRRRSK